MAKISKNGAGIILLVASLFGLDIPEAMAENVVAAVITIISFVLLVWNQIGRPDVAKFFFKR